VKDLIVIVVDSLRDSRCPSVLQQRGIMEQNTNPNGLCKKGCGFYGNDAYEGMCSKCFKDNVKRQQQSSPTAGRNSPGGPATCGSATNISQQTTPISTPPSMPTIQAKTSLVQQAASSPVDIPTPTKTTDTCLTPKPVDSSLDESEASSPSASPSTSDSPLDDGSPGKLKKRNRCYSCKKKVGLTGFECRCGGLYCGLHRYSDKHNCTFDYKTDGREQLAKANPVVVGEKIKKI